MSDPIPGRARGNFRGVVMVIRVPVFKGNVGSRSRLGHEILDLFQQGIGLGGFVDKEFEYLARNCLQ